jgi:hypothetical protein
MSNTQFSEVRATTRFRALYHCKLEFRVGVKGAGRDQGPLLLDFRSTPKRTLANTSLWFEYGVCQPAPPERQPCQPVNLRVNVLTV